MLQMMINLFLKDDQTQFYVLDLIPNIMGIHYYLSYGLNKICYKNKKKQLCLKYLSFILTSTHKIKLLNYNFVINKKYRSTTN